MLWTDVDARPSPRHVDKNRKETPKAEPRLDRALRLSRHGKSCRKLRHYDYSPRRRISLAEDHKRTRGVMRSKVSTILQLCARLAQIISILTPSGLECGASVDLERTWKHLCLLWSFAKKCFPRGIRAMFYVTICDSNVSRECECIFIFLLHTYVRVHCHRLPELSRF